MTISRFKPVAAFAIVAAVALSACSSSGASTAPSTAASGAPPAVRHPAPPARPRARRPSPGASSSTARARSADLRGRRRGVQRRPTPASTSASRSPGPAAGSRSSAPARPTSTTPRGRSRPDDAKEGAACTTNGVDLRPAPGRHRRPDRRRQPGEHLGDLPDAGAAQDDLRPGLAREPDLEPGRPELPEPAGRAVHAGRRLRDVRLLHRGGERRGRCLDLARDQQSEDDNVLVTGVAGDANAISYFGYAYYAENTGQDQGRRRSTAARVASSPTEATINDGTYAPAQPPAVHLPEHDQGQGFARPRRVRRLLPRQCRARCRPRSATCRSRTTLAAAAARQLERRRPAVDSASR